MEKDLELIRSNEELDQQVTYLMETEDTIEHHKADLRNKEDDIRLTLIRQKEILLRCKRMSN